MTFLRSMPCVALGYSSPTTFEYAVVTLSPGTVPSFSASDEIEGDGNYIHALCAVRDAHSADYMLAELMQESVELLDGLLFFHYD